MKKKPAPKKTPRKSAKVTFSEQHVHPDWETRKRKESKDGTDKKSEDKKEFGTPSSRKARHDKKHPPINAGYAESQWIANPDLDRTTTAYSGMTKRELETLGHEYGVEIDRRLKRSTIIRIIELAEEAHRKEVALKEDPVQRMLLQAIFIGMAIGALAGTLFGYALGIA